MREANVNCPNCGKILDWIQQIDGTAQMIYEGCKYQYPVVIALTNCTITHRTERQIRREGERVLVHAEGMLLSDDLPPINRRSITTPHRLSKQEGMEGSSRNFVSCYVPVLPQGNKRNRKGEVERPMTVTLTNLPEITWEEKEKKCSDCNNPTHLLWTCEGFENGFRLCQGCAKRRGDPYALTIRAFTSFFEAKAENWLMKRIIV